MNRPILSLIFQKSASKINTKEMCLYFCKVFTDGSCFDLFPANSTALVTLQRDRRELRWFHLAVQSMKHRIRSHSTDDVHRQPLAHTSDLSVDVVAVIIIQLLHTSQSQVFPRNVMETIKVLLADCRFASGVLLNVLIIRRHLTYLSRDHRD